MAEVIAYSHDGLELVFDTDDVERFETPRDIITTGRWSWRRLRFIAHREFGPHAHLNITFRPGAVPRWRKVVS